MSTASENQSNDAKERMLAGMKLIGKPGSIRMAENLEEILTSAQSLSADVVLEQLEEEDLRELQEMEREIIIRGRVTARSFRQAANTLDKLWKSVNKGHVAGTSIGIVGGLLTIAGGVATMMSAGAATPLLLMGMGAGFTGAGVNVVSSFIEASVNSEEIKQAEEDWMETLAYVDNAKSTVKLWLESKESTGQLFKFLAERHSKLKLSSLGRLIPGLVTGCTALQQSVGKTGAQAMTKAGIKAVDDVVQAAVKAADDVSQAAAKAAAQVADDATQAMVKAGAQAADDAAQVAAKAAAQAADDVAQATAKAGAQAADDVAQAGAKAGANTAKFAGGVIIGVSAVFLVWDVIDLRCTIRDLVNNKGSDAAKVLRAKADELDKLCSSVVL